MKKGQEKMQTYQQEILIIKVIQKISKILFVLSIFYSLISCSQKSYQEKAYNDMKKFVLDEYYSGIGYILFFDTDIRDKKGYITAYSLQRNFYYSDDFKNVDKETFFKKIMFSEIIMNCKNDIDCFILEPSIIKKYESSRFDVFFETNTIASSDKKDTYLIIPSLSYMERISVAYFLYLHNYYTQIDDYTGSFFVEKHPSYKKIETDTSNWIEVY